MTRLKEALAGTEGAIWSRLANIALGIVVPLLSFFAILAFNDIKADNEEQKAQIAQLRDAVAALTVTVQTFGARLDGNDRAQGLIDAAQDRRVDELNVRVQRLEELVPGG